MPEYTGEVIPTKAQEYTGAVVPVASSPEPPASGFNPFEAAIESALSMGTGALASAAGGIAGLAAGAVPGAAQGSSEGVLRGIQDRFTYQPRSEGGKALIGAIALPFEKLAQGADAVGGAAASATGSPLIGAGINTAIQALPQIIARGLKKPAANMLAKSEADATAAASRQSIRDATLADARKEGYVIPPSADGSGGSFIGNRVEGIAGKAATAQEANLRNQLVTNKIARREAGLSEDAPISEAELEKARTRIAAPYREVAKLDPAAEQALETLKGQRADAKNWWRHYQQSAHPDSLKAAQALDAKATATEQFIEGIAQNAGKPDLVARLKQARTELAKNYDVERALNLGSGDVDAHVIGRLLDKRGIDAMSGGLATIGKFAQAFGRYARENAMPPTPGKFEGAMAAHLGMAAHVGGMGWLPAGLPLLSGPARSAVLSPKMMQAARTYGAGAAPKGLEMATRYPEAAALSPELGAIEQQILHGRATDEAAKKAGFKSGAEMKSAFRADPMKMGMALREMDPTAKQALAHSMALDALVSGYDHDANKRPLSMALEAAKGLNLPPPQPGIGQLPDNMLTDPSNLRKIFPGLNPI